MTANTDHLRENGPSTQDELPVAVGVGDKMDGMWRINPVTKSNGMEPGDGLKTNAMNLSTVYYLKDEHHPEQVVRKWVKTNSDVLEKMRRGRFPSLIRDFPPEMKPDAKRLVYRINREKESL